MSALEGASSSSPSSYTQERLSNIYTLVPEIEEIEDRYIFLKLIGKSMPVCRPGLTYELDEILHKVDRFSNTAPPIATILKVQGYLFNGNWVTLIDSQTFIATQSPHIKEELSDLKEDLFWHAIVDNEVPAVINLTGVADGCDNYTAKEIGESKVRACTTGVVAIDTLLALDEQHEHYISTQHSLKIQKDGQEREALFTYIKVSEWVDFAATSVERLSALIDKIEKIRAQFEGKPILVHCRAGVGRTGTVIVACAIKALVAMGEIRSDNYKGYVSALLLSARDQRGKETVQKPEQFCLLLEYARTILASG